MKNRILFLILSIATINAFGQWLSCRIKCRIQQRLDRKPEYLWLQGLDYTRTFGVVPGVALGYNFTDNMGVQLELNYAPVGQDYFDVSSSFSLADDGQGKRLKVETFRYVDLNYLSIPILFRYQSTRAKNQLFPIT